MTGALDCVNVVSAQGFVLLRTALLGMNGGESERQREGRRQHERNKERKEKKDKARQVRRQGKKRFRKNIAA